MPIAISQSLLVRARRAHRAFVYPLLAFVLPSNCFACDHPLGPLQRLGACADCWAGLEILRAPICPTCALPRRVGTDLLGPARGLCAACALDRPMVDSVRAIVAYDAIARAFLLRAKVSGRSALFKPLGMQLALACEAHDWATGCTAVVPVPSHPWMNLRRGFIPALSLARVVAERLGLVLGAGTLGRRPGAGLAVKRLSARQRRSEVGRAIRVRRRLPGDRLLLVDDVMTTGATIEACVRALRSAGAREVRAVVWARTLPERDAV